MPDYHAMYNTLFNAVTDAIRILQDAQIRTEEMFIQHETEVTLLSSIESYESNNLQQSNQD